MGAAEIPPPPPFCKGGNLPVVFVPPFEKGGLGGISRQGQSR
jgi:hypothetical protein